MKSRFVLSAILWLAAQNLTPAAEPSTPNIELKGILASAGLKALLEIRPSDAPGQAGATLPDKKRRVALAKGEKDGDLEVININEANSTVTVRDHSRVLQLALSETPSQGTPASPSLASSTGPGNLDTNISLVGLHGVDLSQALRLYQASANRNIIRPGSLPDSLELDLKTHGTETGAEVAEVIQQALAVKGINIKLDGEKFAIIFGPGADAEKITHQLARARELAATIENTRQASTKSHLAGGLSGSPPKPPRELEILPAGVIHFFSADLNQVLSVYAELTDRTLIRSFLLPAAAISFQTCTPLTREESIYALTAVLALNGASIAAAGGKLLLVTPPYQEGKVAGWLSRKGPLDYAALTNIVQPGRINIRNGSLEMFASVYGQLAGHTLETSADAPPINLGLTSQTELTAGETLQALDLLFAVHGLKVTSQDDTSTLKIVAASQE